MCQSMRKTFRLETGYSIARFDRFKEDRLWTRSSSWSAHIVRHDPLMLLRIYCYTRQTRLKHSKTLKLSNGLTALLFRINFKRLVAFPCVSESSAPTRFRSKLSAVESNDRSKHARLLSMSWVHWKFKSLLRFQQLLYSTPERAQSRVPHEEVWCSKSSVTSISHPTVQEMHAWPLDCLTTQSDSPMIA